MATTARNPFTLPDKLYPPIPEGFDRGLFSDFYFVIALVLGTSIFAGFVVYPWIVKKRGGAQPSLFRRSVMVYFCTSIWIHFGLEQYYALHNREIMLPGNDYIIARLWRYYGLYL